MRDEPEVIKQQMEETRSSLVEKLETLEQRVVNTVSGTTAAVADTVASVKEAVHDTMDTVKGTVHESVDSMRRAVDISHQVDQHPWLFVAGSVAVGYFGACLMQPSSSSGGGEASREGFFSRRADSAPEASGGYDFGNQAQPSSASASLRSDAGGILSTLAKEFSEEINKVKSLAIGTGLGLLRDMIAQTTPPSLRPRVSEVIDAITQKLGGETVRGKVLDSSAEEKLEKGDLH